MFTPIEHHHQVEHSKRVSSQQATTNCPATKSRGWRRSSSDSMRRQTSSCEVARICKRASSFVIAPRLSAGRQFASGTQTTSMNQTTQLKSPRLQLELKYSEQQQIKLGQPGLSNRFTGVACTRASSSSAASSSSSSSSPLSLVISGFVNDEAAAAADESQQSHRLHRRRAIIPNSTCPLLVISILLSILSLSFAAVSFASAPSASASAEVAAAEAEAEAAAKAGKL